MIDFSSGGNNSVGTSLANVNMNNNSVSSLMNFRSQMHASNFSVVGGVSGPPPPLDLNEFPSLGGSSISSFAQSSSSGRPAYVGMVKDNVTSNSTNNEFNIQSEDFPALPGASNVGSSLHFGSAPDGSSGGGPSSTLGSLNPVVNVTNNTNSGGGVGTVGSNNLVGSNDNDSSGDSPLNNGQPTSNANSNKKSGIQVSKDGHVSNIPPGMLTDKYGMAGLLALMQNSETNSNLMSLALGFDISTINLNLNSKERIYHSYPGPFNDKPLKPVEIDYPVPAEYYINHLIRDKLSPVKLDTYSEDSLFFLFYFFAGDSLQLLAARELYNRQWRFHKDEQRWITRRVNLPSKENHPTYEIGSYIAFDPMKWTKTFKELTVKYDRLEPSPAI